MILGVPEKTYYHPNVTLILEIENGLRTFRLVFFAGSPGGVITLGEFVTADDQVTAMDAMERICETIAEQGDI